MPASVLSMSLALTALFSQPVLAAYVLETTYDSTNLFTDFNFFTGDDPTHGYVDYLGFNDAESNNLIEKLGDGVARIKVDSTSVPLDGERGRKSVRLESNKVYNHGLFIADIEHMPSSTCGLWPALWQVGPNWFRDGEVDIIEGVHEATTNLISLHTDGSEGSCTLVANEQNGFVGSAQCDNAKTAAVGCGVSDGPYGTPFNLAGGGVYAMEWLPSSIKVWFFSRGSIPADITSGNPSPSTWGPSVLNVGSTCDIDAHFRNMRVVIDTTFCGDWAGDKNVWEQTSCYLQNPVPENTCANYVKNNPQAYQNGYWDFKSIKVYNAPEPDTGGEDGSISEASPPDAILATPGPEVAASVSPPIITPTSEFIPQETPVPAGQEPTNYFGLDSEPTFSQLAVSPKPNPGKGRGACRANYPTAPPPIETKQGNNLETGAPETDYLQASPGLRVVVSMVLGVSAMIILGIIVV